MTLYLSERDVQDVLSMPLVLDTVAQAMRDSASGRALDYPRALADVPLGSLRVLQAAAPALGYIGFKYTYVRPGRRSCFVHLLDIATGELDAIVDADWLGMMRTGAATGLATQQLANPGAIDVGQIGAGRQGYGQIAAVCAVADVRRIRVFARDSERLDAFCRAMSEKLGVDVLPAASAREAVTGAQVVNVISNSERPVLEGQWLTAGQHINAAGGNSLSRRELDEEAIERADVIVVDGRDKAREECGDLMPALANGSVALGELPELGELLLGCKRGRATQAQITLFESHGLGVQDLYVAATAVKRARALGLGASCSVTVPKNDERRIFA